MHHLQQFEIIKVSEENNVGEFKITPLPRGYGYTLGNPIRRILLSSLEGGAVTSIKIDGVDHEYSTLAGLSDDVLKIILNLKSLAIRCFSDEPVKAVIEVDNTDDKPRDITAADIKAGPEVEMVNPDQVITTITAKTKIKAELIIEKGYGFKIETTTNRPEIGVIPVDGAFSPVENVELKVGNTRVGQSTDLDEIQLIIKTNGVLTPEESLVEAVKIFEKVGNRFVVQASNGFIEPTTEEALEENEANSKNENEEEDSEAILIDNLNLSTRLRNALMNSAITDLRLLEGKNEEDLLEIKGMGKKSAEELVDIMKEHNISVGN